MVNDMKDKKLMVYLIIEEYIYKSESALHSSIFMLQAFLVDCGSLLRMKYDSLFAGASFPFYYICSLALNFFIVIHHRPYAPVFSLAVLSIK